MGVQRLLELAPDLHHAWPVKTATAFKMEEISYTPPKIEQKPEPRSKFEVHPEDYVPPDSFQENHYADGRLKSHGQKMKCDHGIDFAQTCPIGWSYVPKGPSGPECQAPPEFYTETNWCRQQLTPRQVVPASASERTKKDLYDACWLLWPCRDLRHDYKRPCPQGWTWEQDGTCSAPYFYRGTCPFSVNLLNYTKGMKATFAANCGVGWPLDSRYGPAKPKPLPARYPSHAPGQKPDWECKRNFNSTCPDGFNFDGVMCHEDGTYLGANMKNCAHFDARRWTDDMKEAFAAHCHVFWPCVQAPGASGSTNLRNGPVVQAVAAVACPSTPLKPRRQRHQVKCFL